LQLLDCFAKLVIGRRFAPARWLAMTGCVLWKGVTVILSISAMSSALIAHSIAFTFSSLSTAICHSQCVQLLA
jgi:hypothetical protein